MEPPMLSDSNSYWRPLLIVQSGKPSGRPVADPVDRHSRWRHCATRLSIGVTVASKFQALDLAAGPNRIVPGALDTLHPHRCAVRWTVRCGVIGPTIGERCRIGRICRSVGDDRLIVAGDAGGNPDTRRIGWIVTRLVTAERAVELGIGDLECSHVESQPAIEQIDLRADLIVDERCFGLLLDLPLLENAGGKPRQSITGRGRRIDHDIIVDLVVRAELPIPPLVRRSAGRTACCSMPP